MKNVRILLTEKMEGYDNEAEELKYDFKNNLNIKNINKVRLINRYTIEGLNDGQYEIAKDRVLSEKNLDETFDGEFKVPDGAKYFCVQYLKGQYDQRADSANQCIQMITGNYDANVTTSRIIVLYGNLTDSDVDKIKRYYINPVDSCEINLFNNQIENTNQNENEDIPIIDGFINSNDEYIEKFHKDNGLAMSIEDLKFLRDYFKNQEKRNPSMTEIKVIDTYWSDHCRHTTFSTVINSVEIEDGKYNEGVKKAEKLYENARKTVYKDKKKDITLMDIATIGMKEALKEGRLEDFDLSEEINAASIKIKVDVDNVDKDYLLMFKNETHNHPTEIEPFGGAATCIGGAIRDPLSGRAYVYGGMRVTGSADPRQKIEDTMHGKLPQRKITTEAARGFSSYGNQIGLATGYVREIYHSGYAAKRMELGAVIGAVPEENVIRKTPVPGDVVILLGGRTGRDGIGGASGSSKAHTDTSIKTCGAEVQKGNAITERKLQRLFKNADAAKMILRCNDFGAGGVSVAIGELSDGIDINLDNVPKKYEGLDGTETAISESQERMAVVVKKEDAERFMEIASGENLESTVAAVVTDKNRIVMNWKGKKIVDISRDFLNTAGVKGKTDVLVKEPENTGYFNAKTEGNTAEEIILNKLQELNICSEKGLVQRFDGTIGRGSVLIPYGGKYQTTPSEGMVLKLPVDGETNTVSIMTCGYDPYLASWSPFYGGMYSVVEAAAKNVCCGGDYRNIRLTLQEFFGKPEENYEKWGKPYSALLGAYYMQKKLGMPAIGGKDSMSGSFNDMDVPPTIVTFAVCADKAQNVVSPEFKKSGSKVVLLKHKRLENDMPDIEGLTKIFDTVKKLINSKKVLAASSVKNGGTVSEIVKMCLGNMMGFKFIGSFKKNLFAPDYGSIILEVSNNLNLNDELLGIDYEVLGETNDENYVSFDDCKITLGKLREDYEKPLDGVFQIKAEFENKKLDDESYNGGMKISPVIKTARPKVLIPVFPGTNCEYDSARTFAAAGANVETFVIRNRNSEDVLSSIDELKEKIDRSNIVMLSGGFSAGDEPDGSGKFIAAVFRNPKISDAVMELLYVRDGLMLGICNGFQALIKLGLVPFGKIVDIDKDSPSLTYNTIGRHISKIVNTKVVSNLSPWYSCMNVGDVHKVAISHGEGRFVYSESKINELMAKGQVACRYVDFAGKPTMDSEYNPNGSMLAVEAITSPDGRVLGKMGHSERYGKELLKNIPGFNEEKIFEGGVK